MAEPLNDQYVNTGAENNGADTLTTERSQATASDGAPIFRQDQINRNLSSQDDAVLAPDRPGVGAGTSSNSADSRGNDNTPPASRSANQQAINQNFGNQAIVPRPNELDQYASYTYAISWWLLTPDQYNKLASGKAPAPGTGNWSLLMQSGGAPIAGRNQFFPDDYYLDDLEIETFLMGKGTNMSTNGIEIRFKVVEPNGITLIQRLFEAVVAAYKNSSQVPNYAAAQYCLTIEFYGYDSQGNLVAPARAQGGATGDKAVIKKYYPFLLRNITFRTVANQIEYNIVANAIPYETGTAQARGTIPFAFALSGQTVGQILQGIPGGAGTEVSADDGRTSSPSPEVFTSNPTAAVNDTSVNAGVDAMGNFTGETQNPFTVVAP